MNPVQHMTPVAALHLTPGITERDMPVAFITQASAFLVKEGISGHDEGPETQDGGGIHELVVVETEQVFGIAEQDLDVPTGGDMIDQGGRIGIQVTGGPVAHRLERTVQGETSDDDLAGVELAHARANYMHVDRAWVFLARPSQLVVLFRFQACGVLIQAHPVTLPLGVEHPQRPIGLQPTGHQKTPVPGRAPDTFAGIPAVHQDVGQGVG